QAAENIAQVASYPGLGVVYELEVCRRCLFGQPAVIQAVTPINLGNLMRSLGSHCHRELEVELLNTAQHWPRQSADGLAPPEWLLNPLALLLADLVSTMADSATIDGGEAIGRVLGHVRCNVEVPHVGHKVSRIEAFVGTHCDALGSRRIAHDHVFRGFALDRARHLSQFRLDD